MFDHGRTSHFVAVAALMAAVACAALAPAANRLPELPSGNDATRRCEAARDVVVGKYFACLKQAQAKEHELADGTAGDPCESTFAADFAALRDRHADACDVSATAASRLERLLDATAQHSTGDAVRATAILPEPLPGSSEKCEWAKSMEYCDDCMDNFKSSSACLGGDPYTCAEDVYEETGSIDACKDCCACEEWLAGDSNKCNECIDDCQSF